MDDKEYVEEEFRKYGERAKTRDVEDTVLHNGAGDQLTWGEAAQVIADAWNEDEKCPMEFSADDIMKLHPTGELYWFPRLYEVAKEGSDMLTGLLLVDWTYAKLFIQKMDAKEKEK